MDEKLCFHIGFLSVFCTIIASEKRFVKHFRFCACKTERNVLYRKSKQRFDRRRWNGQKAVAGADRKGIQAREETDRLCQFADGEFLFSDYAPHKLNNLIAPAQAGFTRPNPEYCCQPGGCHPSGCVVQKPQLCRSDFVCVTKIYVNRSEN